MSISSAANGRHVVTIEDEDVTPASGGAGVVLGRTRYRGLYFQDDEVATCWAVESFQRSPDGGAQKGFTVNLYEDGSTTVMAFEGDKKVREADDGNRFRGTWSFVSGSGRFEGITGGGDYEGRSYDGIAYSNVSGNVAVRGRK